MGLLVQSDMATPVIGDLGTKRADRRVSQACTARGKDRLTGRERAGSGQRRGRHPHRGSKKTASDYLISGQKTFITNGARANFITLLAKTNPEHGAHGCSFFLVPTNLPGFQVVEEAEEDRQQVERTPRSSSSTTCAYPKRYLLGEENMGFMYLMQNFQTERLVACISAVVRRLLWSLEEAIQYGKDRTAFGKPIIKREVWQHKFVDLYTKLEAAKAFSYKIVDRYNDERYIKKEPLSMETVKLISMAKIFVAETTSEIMDQCLQFHGGWGYIEDFRIARAWRDSRLLRIGGGTTETMRYYVAKILGL